jgi:choline dehydrogenase-like flavoprotein
VDIKFSFANCLDDQNGIYSHANDGYTPFISFKRFSWLDDLLNSRFPAVAGWQKSAGEFLTLLNNTRDSIFNEFNDVEFQTARYGELGNDQKPFGWGTVHHACGTLRMPWKANRGAAFNTRSVVDENLKVHGTSGLYVCDMSVLPVSTAANPVRALAGLALRLSKHLD